MGSLGPVAGDTTAFRCWYCGQQAGGRRITVREMYFGTGEPFDYIECSACRSWCIERIPQDLARHYPKAYGAHRSPEAGGKRAWGPRQWLRNLRTAARLGHLGDAVARWVEARYSELEPYPWRWLRMAGVGRHSSILDVGCGNGSLLRTLHAEGFTRLRGIDRFYPSETRMPGLVIGVGDVFAVQGQFDLVMLHHSLEHMPEPFEVLQQAKKLLLPGGRLLVRVPLADCVAHREFGEYWFQIDAPRHLAVPSLHGVWAIAERLGLAPVGVDFDSTATQFAVSAAYQQGVSLQEQRLRAATAGADSQPTLEARAADLNRMGLGDMAAFVFRVRG